MKITAHTQQIESLRKSYDEACGVVERRAAAYDDVAASTNDSTTLAVTKARLDEAVRFSNEVKEELERQVGIGEARAKFKKEPLPESSTRIGVSEPDMYTRESNNFLQDLYSAQLRNDPIAQERIAKHHTHEVEKYAVSTGTLGGIVPPQYLVDLYAKAQRFGRVFADQCNRQEMPEQGLSFIVPRLTAGTAAAVQTSESSAVTTQDPTETDLTVNVRTIAGYSPVSRQTLERAAYSEAILMEDLVARYMAALDVQLISGSGSSGQHLGVLNVSGISTASISSWTAANAWAGILGESGVLTAINSWAATIGSPADTIVMHPRRWGAFLGLLDTQNRPLIVPEASGQGYNVMATGEATGYGFVGRLGGVPVFTDANVPTNLGGSTNQDVIIAMASNAVPLWERQNDPVTLAFEQQAGTSLQVQLVCYGYSAFAAGRYPAAVGIVSGAGLT